jgi:hypothetical protein
MDDNLLDQAEWPPLAASTMARNTRGGSTHIST